MTYYRYKGRFTCPWLCTVLWEFCERHFSTNMCRPSMIHLLHHGCDAFELCHALWAIRVTRRPPLQVTLERLGQGACANYAKQTTGLFWPGPRGITGYILIESFSTVPQPARMRVHGVWRVQTVLSNTGEMLVTRVGCRLLYVRRMY